MNGCREALPSYTGLRLELAKSASRGAEIIGWDPVRGAYITQYFGSDGQNAYHATLIEEEGALVWSMRSQTDRFAGRFTSDGNTINGHWERLDEHENWQPWMDITLTRQS